MGQGSAHPLPSWPFTSCPPSSYLSQLSRLLLSETMLISRLVFSLLSRFAFSLSFYATFFPSSIRVSVSVPPVEMQPRSFLWKRTGQQDLASSRTDARLGRRRPTTADPFRRLSSTHRPARTYSRNFPPFKIPVVIDDITIGPESTDFRNCTDDFFLARSSAAARDAPGTVFADEPVRLWHTSNSLHDRSLYDACRRDAPSYTCTIQGTVYGSHVHSFVLESSMNFHRA